MTTYLLTRKIRYFLLVQIYYNICKDFSVVKNVSFIGNKFTIHWTVYS
jgi:hypothetical protein